MSLISDVDSVVPDELRKQLSLIDEIVETNKETLSSVCEKIEDSGEQFDFIFLVIEYSFKIRPLNAEPLHSLHSLLFQKHDCKNHEISNWLSEEKYYSDKEMAKILMQDDLESFIKKKAEIGFDQKSEIDVDPGSSIGFVCEDENFFYFKHIFSYLQIMAFYGAIKCFKHASLNNEYDFDDVEKFAVAGGNMEIVHILEQRNISFEDCLEVSITFHRNELSDWILIHYGCQKSSLNDSYSHFNYRAVIFGLMNGISINNNLLCLESASGQLEIVKYLLEQCHENVETKDKNGHTPIYIASLNGHLDVVKYLYETCHANITEEEIKNFKNEEIKAYFNLMFADKPSDFENDIYKASEQGKLASVKYLIERCHANIETKNKYGFTPINSASYNGRLDVVKHLYEKCHADVETEDKCGRTPINNASLNDHYEVVKYLYETCHSDVETKDKYGRTPIFNASENGRLEIVKYLYNTCHADVETKDNNGYNLINIASLNGLLDVVKYLHETCHAKISNDAINKASENGYLEVVKYLYETCDANAETKDNYGNTPINIASSNGYLEVVKYLYEMCHADVETKDKCGFTPINIASLKGHLDVVKYLYEACHANVKTVDKCGYTPMDYASSKGHLEIVKYLREICHTKITK